VRIAGRRLLTVPDHGVQIPVDHGQKTYDAACNSRARKLVVLGPEDGGVEHCSIDNFPLVRDLAADWIADTLCIA